SVLYSSGHCAVRVGMAVSTALIAKTVAHDADSRRREFLRVALVAVERAMTPLERIASEALVQEVRDLEVSSRMAKVARALRLMQAELASVNVVVAAFTGSRCEPIAGPFARLSICLGCAVTSATGGRSVRSGQWPNAVIDLGQIPIRRGMASRAAVPLHLLVELVSVRILVAIRARSFSERPIQALSFAGHAVVALRAGDGRMVTGEREPRRGMQSDAEKGGPK